ACLLELTDHLATRLRHEGVQARCVELKIRSSEFRTWSRSQTLPEPTDQTDVLWQAAADLFQRSLLDEMLPLRLLRVATSRLTREPAAQGKLFDQGERRRRSGLDRTVDAIRQQLGPDAVRRGSLVERPKTENDS